MTRHLACEFPDLAAIPGLPCGYSPDFQSSPTTLSLPTGLPEAVASSKAARLGLKHTRHGRRRSGRFLTMNWTLTHLPTHRGNRRGIPSWPTTSGEAASSNPAPLWLLKFYARDARIWCAWRLRIRALAGRTDDRVVRRGQGEIRRRGKGTKKGCNVPTSVVVSHTFIVGD